MQIRLVTVQYIHVHVHVLHNTVTIPHIITDMQFFLHYRIDMSVHACLNIHNCNEYTHVWGAVCVKTQVFVDLTLVAGI